jgi:hypothetical protein
MQDYPEKIGVKHGCLAFSMNIKFRSKPEHVRESISQPMHEDACSCVPSALIGKLCDADR